MILIFGSLIFIIVFAGMIFAFVDREKNNGGLDYAEWIGCSTNDLTLPNEFQMSLCGGDSDCVPVPDGNDQREPPIFDFRPTNLSRPPFPFWFEDLETAIIQSRVFNQSYNGASYDCDDFAGDLEKNLTVRGYNSTFTYVFCGRTRFGHAYTDVHAPDGTILFIEAQIDPRRRGIYANLDFNRNGRVSARNNTHVNNSLAITEGECAVEIFENREAAIAAGVRMD